MEKQTKLSFQEYIKNQPANVDVIIQTFISKGTLGITLELPKGTNGILPSFQSDMLVETKFEVKKFTKEFPSVLINQNYRWKNIYTSGTSEDKITATFKLEWLSIANLASNPILKIGLTKNPYDMSGQKPYLEILVAKLCNDGKIEYYQPIKGITEFGKNEINLFTNPITKLILND